MSTTVPVELATLLEGGCALPQLGVIQAQGEDAAQFLHNQLTQDVLLLSVGQSRLAAFCSAKGRMQASFVLLKAAPETVLLVMPVDLLAQTLKRLSMFVLRAKVRLSDASAHWQLQGLAGAAALTVLGGASGQVPAWQTLAQDGSWAIALPPAGLGEQRVQRALCLVPADRALPVTSPLDASLWAWGEVLSAVPLITAPLFEAFVPQMLNYESVGGVNFKKGCYPGQEVVARSQFRGTLKRRLARLWSPLALQPGQELFSPADPEQACATVVQCAPRPDGNGHDVLASGTLESMASGWHANSAQGPGLTLLPLPYPLLEDI